MASIRRRNGKYQVQIRVGSYSRSQSFHKLNDAKSWARKEEELAQQRRYLGSKYEPSNLAEILFRYLRDVTPHKRSSDTERIVLQALLKENWVNGPLPLLNAAAIAEYRDKRLATVKPATLKRQLNTQQGHTCVKLIVAIEDIRDIVAETDGAPEMDPDQPTASQSSFLFEKHLEDFLVKNWRNLPIGNQYDIYEENGEQVGQQFRTGTGPIDILGLNKDKSDFLVLELKRDRASDVVVGQTLRYMGWVQEHLCSPAQSVNGCIIAHAKDERLQYALNQVPNIRFMKYEVDFRLVG